MRGHCGDCEFFNPVGAPPRSPVGVQEGECRRYPPTWAPSEEHPDGFAEGWPGADEEDWCGEFKEREEPSVPPAPTEYGI
jgi:hypothetical protein